MHRARLSLRRVTAGAAPLPRPDGFRSFCRIRSARWRVGRIFSCRLTRLMRVQIAAAVSIASSSDSWNSGGSRISDRGTRSRASVRKRSTYQALQHVLVGVEIDREIEEVGHERDRLAVLRQAPGLQHVQALRRSGCPAGRPRPTGSASRRRPDANRPARAPAAARPSRRTGSAAAPADRSFPESPSSPSGLRARAPRSG